jgi:hypothetical protein
VTILTPAEVAERAKCSVRQAFKLMRSAGAVSCRDANGNQSLRITEERFSEWLKNVTVSTSAALSGGSERTRLRAKRGRRTAATLRPLAGTEQSSERLAADPSHAAAETARLDEWIRRVIAVKESDGSSTSTVEVYRTKLGHWLRLAPGAMLADITPDFVDAYVAQRRTEEVTDHTISKEVTHLCTVLKAAKRAGCYPLAIETLRPPGLHAGYKPRKRALTREEVVALMAELKPELAALVAICVSLGCRLSEAYRSSRPTLARPASTSKEPRPMSQIATSPSSASSPPSLRSALVNYLLDPNQTICDATLRRLARVLASKAPPPTTSGGHMRRFWLRLASTAMLLVAYSGTPLPGSSTRSTASRRRKRSARSPRRSY